MAAAAAVAAAAAAAIAALAAADDADDVDDPAVALPPPPGSLCVWTCMAWYVCEVSVAVLWLASPIPAAAASPGRLLKLGGNFA